MYLLGYRMMIYVGSIVVAPPAGYLYDKIGFEHTYLLMGSCARCLPLSPLLRFRAAARMGRIATFSRRWTPTRLNRPNINSGVVMTKKVITEALRPVELYQVDRLALRQKLDDALARGPASSIEILSHAAINSGRGL